MSRDVARVLFRSKDFAETKRLVKPRAFMPHDGELSVAELTGLDGRAVPDLIEEIERHRGLRSKARAELSVDSIVRTGLRFERDDQPYHRHGNILGWPTGPAAKAHCQSLAQQLSSVATLVMHA